MPLVFEDLAMALIILIGFTLVLSFAVIQIDMADRNQNVDHESMTWMPHYVKIKVMPECRDCAIALWASDDLPVTSGYTDDQSEIVFPLISAVKYHVVCPERNISILLYPRESEYVIWGKV